MYAVSKTFIYTSRGMTVLTSTRCRRLDQERRFRLLDNHAVANIILPRKARTNRTSRLVYVHTVTCTSLQKHPCMSGVSYGMASSVAVDMPVVADVLFQKITRRFVQVASTIHT